jgi:hypothetical protein
MSKKFFRWRYISITCLHNMVSKMQPFGLAKGLPGRVVRLCIGWERPLRILTRNILIVFIARACVSSPFSFLFSFCSDL